MKVVCFSNAEYSYRKDNIHKGYVVLIHFDPFDDKEIIKKAAKSISKKAAKDDVILVPFAHLYDKVAPIKEASSLYDLFCEDMRVEFNAKIVKVPFNIEKSFKLNVLDDNAVINYFSFKPSHINEIKRLYDVFADGYDLHMEKTGHYKAQDFIYKKVKPCINEPIIDLACGPGHILKLLASDYQKVIGNDVSEEMLSIARRNIDSKTILFTQTDATKLKTLDQNRFGTIISSNLFYYIKDKEKAIKNWKNNLSKNGRIVFIEEFPFIQPKSHELPGKESGITSIIQPVSPAEIVGLMKQNGFSLILDAKVEIDKSHSLYGLVFEIMS